MKTIEIVSKKYGLFTVFVDDKDFDRVKNFRWSVNSRAGHCYAICYKAGGLMHRVILRLKDPHVLVDHKDQNGLNNTRKNMRICRNGQNQANRPPIKGKYNGVCWCRFKRKWKAQIKKYGHVYNLGVYETQEDAAIAYNAAAPVLHGKFAYLNKIL